MEQQRRRRYTAQDLQLVFDLWFLRMKGKKNFLLPGHYTFRDLARDTEFPLSTLHRFVKRFESMYPD